MHECLQLTPCQRQVYGTLYTSAGCHILIVSSVSSGAWIQALISENDVFSKRQCSLAKLCGTPLSVFFICEIDKDSSQVKEIGDLTSHKLAV